MQHLIYKQQLKLNIYVTCIFFFFGTSDEDVKLSLKHVISAEVSLWVISSWHKTFSKITFFITATTGQTAHCTQNRLVWYNSKSKSKQEEATKRAWRSPTLLTNDRSQEGAHDRQTDLSCLAPHKNRDTKGSIPTKAPSKGIWAAEIAANIRSR